MGKNLNHLSLGSQHLTTSISWSEGWEWFWVGYVGGNNLVMELNLSPYSIGPPDPRSEFGAVYETSKEDSFNAKFQPLSSGGQMVGRSAASLGYRNED
ncbi:uncharacterized protein Pyn_40507 [Prunus yedoensis var. nudiflora]|uniref:Uncharacterized protein n=1 Tax=Prunus yedoensis var. nudiflora TaxID=2094558 RepID=A0A314UK57_PRUYE|nr:uncharacterized protein Pyn_40507 [Prunus yedoensis var. nudiflora]